MSDQIHALMDSQTVRDGERQAQDDTDKREAKRNTPEARAGRSRSRTAFADQSDGDALDTGRKHFDEVFAHPLWEQPSPARGERVRRYVDGFSALIDRASGPDVIPGVCVTREQSPA